MESPQYNSWPEKIETILFIIVMTQEAEPTIKKFNLKKVEDTNNLYTIYQNTVENKKIVLIMGKPCEIYKVDPVGSDQAVLLTQLGIQYCQPDLVVSAGTCGGVDDVKQYDVCVPQQSYFIDREIILDFYKGFLTSEYPMLDPTRMVEVLKLKKVKCGTTNSFTKDNTLAREKKVHIVEMEAASECRVCYLNKIAFTAIKIVSDVEMEDEKERQNLFMQFLKEGPQKLADVLYEFVQKLDQVKV